MPLRTNIIPPPAAKARGISAFLPLSPERGCPSRSANELEELPELPLLSSRAAMLRLGQPRSGLDLCNRPHSPPVKSIVLRIQKSLPCALPLALVFLCSGLAPLTAASLLQADYRNLLARADLVYTQAVQRSEEGLPVGNGRMGSLVWTTPAALHLQVNRADVFANGCDSDSFPERHTDYCGGCGFVDVEFVDFGNDVFPAQRTRQQLSCYDGQIKLEGRGVTAQVLACARPDVLALQLNDTRKQPGTISINLRMLRAPFVRTASHTASSKLEARGGDIVLTQQFAERDYFCGSALAVRVLGRKAELRRANEREWRLVVAPGKDAFTVLIASAASFLREEDLVASALGQLESATDARFGRLENSNREWWHDFWSKSFIHLHSADGVADHLEQNYNYYLYLMGCTSRGKLPTKFNGMLWTTGGDLRRWGGQFWGANQSCLYNNALLAANHSELLDPMFDMYSGMLDSCARAAREQWGSQGVYIPETVGFDGLAALPEDIAAEMRQLYLLRKPWETRSKRFLDFAGTKLAYSSRWNWMGPGKWVEGRWTYTERGGGPYGPVTHIFSRQAKIAYQYWLRYEYSGDLAWLRERAYPVLRGVAEFYRNYPNVSKGDDGLYHIQHVNSNEGVWGARDTDEEIASMRGLFPVTLKASELLGADTNLAPAWREFLDHLPPLPRSDDPAAQPLRATNRAPVWIRGLPPIVRGFGSGRPDGNTMPAWFFDLCTLESDPQTLHTGMATFDSYFPDGFGSSRRVGVLSKIPLVAAILGRADALAYLLPSQIDSREVPVLANRMDLREGPQTTSAQRLGNAADALHTALCQDLPAGPGQPPVLRVFAAWPVKWDAEFTLLSRGGFLVASAMRAGKIEFVQIQSQRGGECRLRNPWPAGRVDLYRNDGTPETLDGDLLRFNTATGETVTLVPAGLQPEPYKRTVAGRK